MTTIICPSCKRPRDAKEFSVGQLVARADGSRGRSLRCCAECMDKRIARNMQDRGIDWDEMKRLKAAGQKRCTACKQVKDVKEFGTRTDGRIPSRCLVCMRIENVHRRAAKKAQLQELGLTKRTPTPKIGGQGTEIYQRLLKAGARGMTCDELEVGLGFYHQSVATRVKELRDTGWLEEADTRPTRTGKKARVFVALTEQLRDVPPPKSQSKYRLACQRALFAINCGDVQIARVVLQGVMS